MQVIGTIHTPFKEKFGIPRQSQLVDEAEGLIIFEDPFDQLEAFRDIENYDHLWLISHFHQIAYEKWSPLVRPPRLGGNTKMGVFATRSPFRPNQLGLSLVRLKEVMIKNGKVMLKVCGVDLLDGTPILDIKPYLPDTESIPHAKNSWRQDMPHHFDFEIKFSPSAKLFLESRINGESEKKLICAVLCQDPRPGHHRKMNVKDDQEYGMKIFDYDVRWMVEENVVTVLQIVEDQLFERGENE